MSRIFLLEDDISLINGLSFAFKRQGFDLTVARTLREAHDLWADGAFDLLVLDVSLPDGMGFAFCSSVRRVSKVPIIFLTASDEEMSIIMGLDMGGDDYITKPFKLGILMSRIHALLRRARDFGAPGTQLNANGIKVLNLRERRNHLPSQLSGGQQQRVAIGRALMTRPSLILADEPTGNLDSQNSSEVIALLRQASKQYEQTIIMITHNRSKPPVSGNGLRAICMQRGRRSPCAPIRGLP